MRLKLLKLTGEDVLVLIVAKTVPCYHSKIVLTFSIA